MTLRVLDLFCGAGGAAKGYHDGFTAAGFDVEITGVDIKPQPNYPYTFVQADAMTYPLGGFDFIHASPPCQAYSSLKSKTTRVWADLLAATRARLAPSGTPWAIENVMPAPMDSGIVLCGEMFGLRTIRHRRFETSMLVMQPHHPAHTRPTSTKKRPRQFAEGYHISVTGDVGSWVGPACMGIDWMNGNELSEAIPPAYTAFLAEQIAPALLEASA